MQPGYYVQMRYKGWEDLSDWRLTGKQFKPMTYQQALDLIQDLDGSRYSEGWEYQVIRVEVVEPVQV